MFVCLEKHGSNSKSRRISFNSGGEVGVKDPEYRCFADGVLESGEGVFLVRIPREWHALT
jgi:hypothetical protein